MAAIARADCFVLTCLGCGERQVFPVDRYDDRSENVVQPEVKGFAAAHRSCSDNLGSAPASSVVSKTAPARLDTSGARS